MGSGPHRPPRSSPPQALAAPRRNSPPRRFDAGDVEHQASRIGRAIGRSWPRVPARRRAPNGGFRPWSTSTSRARRRRARQARPGSRLRGWAPPTTRADRRVDRSRRRGRSAEQQPSDHRVQEVVRERGLRLGLTGFLRLPGAARESANGTRRPARFGHGARSMPRCGWRSPRPAAPMTPVSPLLSMRSNIPRSC